MTRAINPSKRCFSALLLLFIAFIALPARIAQAQPEQPQTQQLPIFHDVSAAAGITATHRGIWDDKERRLCILVASGEKPAVVSRRQIC